MNPKPPNKPFNFLIIVTTPIINLNNYAKGSETLQTCSQTSWMNKSNMHTQLIFVQRHCYPCQCILVFIFSCKFCWFLNILQLLILQANSSKKSRKKRGFVQTVLLKSCNVLPSGEPSTRIYVDEFKPTNFSQ